MNQKRATPLLAVWPFFILDITIISFTGTLRGFQVATVGVCDKLIRALSIPLQSGTVL
jgi:hypothetical protein